MMRLKSSGIPRPRIGTQQKLPVPQQPDIILAQCSRHRCCNRGFCTQALSGSIGNASDGVRAKYGIKCKLIHESSFKHGEAPGNGKVSITAMTGSVVTDAFLLNTGYS